MPSPPTRRLIPPVWINALPQETGKVYALGAAPLGDNPALALKQASQSARLELATRLRASVKGETSLSHQMTVQRTLGQAPSASDQQHITQDSKVTTQWTELTGLEIVQTWTDGEDRTVYALACLDVSAAMEALKERALALKPGLKGVGVEEVEPREAAKAVLRLRAAREETVRLEALAAPLVDSGGDPAFRPLIHDLQADIDRRADGLRDSLTLGVEAAAALPPEVLATLRLAAQEKGFGWTESQARLRVRVQLPTKPRPWWTEDGGSDFITARATFQLSLADVQGTPLGSAAFEATGIGTASVNANQGLMKDLRKKLGAALDRWMNDLAL